MLPTMLCGLLFSGSITFWLLLACTGAIAGPVLFFKGFGMLRFKRLILNTPLSRIHSASIGLVEVTGNPVGPYVLSAPITGGPCYYYRVRAWQWVEAESGKSHEWKSVLDESLHVPFFLEDSTGRVLIDPQGADLDVHRSFLDEVGASFFRTDGLLPPNIRDFLVKRGLVPYEKIRLEERVIAPGFPLFVFGTLGENPATQAGLIHARSNSTASVSVRGPSVGGSDGFAFDMRTNLSGRTAVAMGKVLSHVPGAQVATSEVEVAGEGDRTVSPDRAGMVVAGKVLPKSAKPSPDKSAFGEFDLHPTVAIGKGERHGPFTISGYSQRELVGKLAWKSALYIWGGPVLAITCLYCLLKLWTFVSF
jgi:E3 Ubiquitin ligase